MPNIAETSTARNLRSVNDRRSHQCARPGWRPPQCSPCQQAANIAASIEARIAERRAWSMAEYGITDQCKKRLYIPQ